MSSADPAAAFQELLSSVLVPAFCADPSRSCTPASFRGSSAVSAFDARWFLRGWEAGLLQHRGRGLYRAPRSAASEQFFWTGSKVEGVRSFTLWREPVITVAALARLHLEFGWPATLIGTQSVDWAFDLVAFRPGDTTEAIAGEVKKTVREVDDLIELMTQYGRDPTLAEPTGGKARNAWRKVAALRARAAPLFWAVGPDGYGRVFRVRRDDAGVVAFAAADEVALHHAPAAATSPPTALATLHRLITDDPMPALDGDHGARLWRIAENARQAIRDGDDRLPHVLSRVAVLARGVADDLRTGRLSPERAATLLDRLAMMGDLSDAEWREPPDV